MTDDRGAVLDAIWDGDLFDRRTEAAHLEAYIETLAGQPSLREDKHAFTIAVDAGYGVGKTFFLRRFAEQLAMNHPVAFVDAWVDDITDEPFIALTATLKQALAPYLPEADVRSTLSTFISKAGQVTKIASKGLLRRAATMVLTGVAVEGIEGVLSDFSDEAEDVGDSVAGPSGSNIGVAVDAAATSAASHALMSQRLAEFEQGRAAVRQTKKSLGDIVNSLGGEKAYPPIVIVVDELDRCRPTYAITMLEKIKHLFDVPGIVFILGMHGGQLAHAISGAYGATFDGRAYLRRFIDRELTLAPPRLEPLLEQLCKAAGITQDQIAFEVIKAEKDTAPVGLPAILASYMRIYDIAPRDAFQLVHIIQTCISLAQGKRLVGLYLVPLIIGHIISLPHGSLPKAVREVPLMYHKVYGDPQNEMEVHFPVAAQQVKDASDLDESAVREAAEAGRSLGAMIIAETREWHTVPRPVWDVSRYPDLIETVGRFKNPSSSV